MRVWRGKDDVKSLVLLLYFGESTQSLFTDFHFCTEYQTLLTSRAAGLVEDAVVLECLAAELRSSVRADRCGLSPSPRARRPAAVFAIPHQPAARTLQPTPKNISFSSGKKRNFNIISQILKIISEKN